MGSKPTWTVEVVAALVALMVNYVELDLTVLVDIARVPMACVLAAITASKTGTKMMSIVGGLVPGDAE